MANISELKFDDKNFNKHTERGMSLLEKSLRQNGAGRSILLDKDNNIIAGNGVVEAAGQIGLENVKIVETTGDEIVAVKRTDISLNSREGREMALADNATAKADIEWDKENLQSEFTDEELKEWIDDVDWSEENKEVVEDEAPEVNESEPADSELGKVYQLGNHRLMCGDSTDAESVAILMDGQKADMVFTDPPYKLQTDGGPRGDIGQALRKQGRSIEFISDFDPKEFLEVLPQQFEKNVLNAYIFCNKELLPDYLNWAVKNGFSYNVLVWKKPNAIPICDSHRPDIEYLLLFRKNAIWNNGLSGVNYSRCVEYGREQGLHPTMKPIGLITNEMKISSNIDSNILDLFGGSGSTLIACEQLGRKCYMMELDPKYCDVIRKRYWKFKTGSEEGWQDGTKANIN
jgi:DNA modification methylase